MTDHPGTRPHRAAQRGRRLAASSSRAARAGITRVRRATHARGAGESGLAKVIELHAFNAAGDTVIAVALAGTLFFSVPLDEARWRVAVYLALTMAPFAVLAPLVGPLLDRVRHGRRWAIGTSTALRAFLCWVLAGAVSSDELWLYPAAFGCLVASRAYSVSRAAALPRVLPGSATLVSANSRVSLAGVAGAAVAAPLAGGLVWLGGPDWALRLGFVVFIVATVLAIRLPARVDSSAGEAEASLSEGTLRQFPSARPGPATQPGWRGRWRGRRFRVGSAVVRALRGNAALRGFAGFLTIYLAFLLREVPVGGLSPEAGIAAAAACALLGGTLGSAFGAWSRAGRPDRLVLALVVLVTVAASAVGLFWGLVTALAVSLVAGFAQQLGRLSLDAVVQREVPENVRTSAFARSETTLQLAWVLGGGLGIALPLEPRLGFGVAAAALVLGLVAALRVRVDTPTRQ